MVYPKSTNTCQKIDKIWRKVLSFSRIYYLQTPETRDLGTRFITTRPLKWCGWPVSHGTLFSSSWQMEVLIWTNYLLSSYSTITQKVEKIIHLWDNALFALLNVHFLKYFYRLILIFSFSNNLNTQTHIWNYTFLRVSVHCVNVV